MLRRGQTTTFQERQDITERAAAGQPVPEIAAALVCSVWTVRKWRRRGQHQGRTGLNSQMGRPTTGPLGTFPTEMRDAILHLRRTHPGWGPTTLVRHEAACVAVKLPKGGFYLGFCFQCPARLNEVCLGQCSRTRQSGPESVRMKDDC